MKKTDIAANSLIGIIDLARNISENGATKSASLANTNAHAMLESMLDGYHAISGKVEQRNFTFTWKIWSSIDRKYNPPSDIMEEQKLLVRNFLIGASACVLYYPEKSEALKAIKILASNTLTTAKRLMRGEIIAESDEHRIMHIVALFTTLTLTIRAIISAIKGSGNLNIEACENLCGIIETESENPGNQLAKPAKYIKRHRKSISQNELADMWRCSSASINTCLKKITNVLSNCRSDRLISLAEKSGINTCVKAKPPCDENGTIVWYDSKEACKFLDKQSIEEIPPFFRPKAVLNDGVEWYRESDLESVAESMGIA